MCSWNASSSSDWSRWPCGPVLISVPSAVANESASEKHVSTVMGGDYEGEGLIGGRKIRKNDKNKYGMTQCDIEYDIENDTILNGQYSSFNIQC